LVNFCEFPTQKQKCVKIFLSATKIVYQVAVNHTQLAESERDKAFGQVRCKQNSFSERRKTETSTITRQANNCPQSGKKFVNKSPGGKPLGGKAYGDDGSNKNQK